MILRESHLCVIEKIGGEVKNGGGGGVAGNSGKQISKQITESQIKRETNSSYHNGTLLKEIIVYYTNRRGCSWTEKTSKLPYAQHLSI